MPSSIIDFQTMIMKLQEFWAAQGCLVWQPYYSQVGAGTNNPATILRVLGPEPWQVGYVEPSVRPDDGRYGENPNRLQMHYQYQVILKPDPGNPQELYLQSLEAMGINPRQHDIRFVEDNWESPAFGAWGLGWEVWLDGQEITQFTYFQQACGQVLDPVSVEITYGLERIAIALQRVSNFRDIQWSPKLTYGDVNLQGEQEHSRYYFDIADVVHQRQMYELYETEARICLEQQMVLPALDYILKCSHTFNVLDSRGAVGVTERQAMFGRMRDLSRRMAEIYVEQRTRLEYPFLEGQAEDGALDVKLEKQNDPGWQAIESLDEQPFITVQSPFLLEIGTEELPAGDLDAALEQLRQRVPEMMKEIRLDHGEIRVMGTPRRLVVYVEDVAPYQPDQEVVFRGPPAKRAFGPDGETTQAAEGFARSKGVEVSELRVREMDGGEYVVAVVQQPGRASIEVFSECLPALVASLRFEKPMRWNSSNVAFSRPVRWLVALLGAYVVPFEFAGLHSGRVTRGLRFRQPEEILLHSPQEYIEALTQQNILLDPQARRQAILQQVEALASEVGGVIEEDFGLLDEVANLVEMPSALRGSFDNAYLDLPIEVLVSVMKKHQRYFPVSRKWEGAKPSSVDGAITQDHRLLPYFITVSNGDHLIDGSGKRQDLVTEGNQHVIRARFADARFFIHQDLEQTLVNYLPRLGTLIFQTKLGSMLDKTNRMVRLVDDLAVMVGMDSGEAAVTRRAAELCKADLVTHMVVEMTSLQGVMGRYYALRSGEKEQVAQAIFEHYLPRFSGDQLPVSLPGVTTGMADRLDSLVGLFAAGLAPSGNKDPFGQRRAALGLVQILTGLDLVFDLRAAIQSAAKYQPVAVDAGIMKMVGEFITERLRNFLMESGGRYDVIDAVLAAQWYNPAGAHRSIKTLGEWIKRPDWHTILPAYARCVRITRPVGEVYDVQENIFVEDAEQVLWEALRRAELAPRAPGSVDDFLNAFLPMIQAIDRFFEIVLVMTEEERLRQNRLGLLQRIAGLADGVADLSKLEGF